MTEQEMRAALALQGISTDGLDFAAVVALYENSFSAPAARPDWATPETQLPFLREALGGIPAGERDEEIKSLFLAAIEELDGPEGSLGRSLVPTERAAFLDWRFTTAVLPLRPVIEVLRFEHQDQNDQWTEVAGSYELTDGYRLTWSGSTALGRRARVIYRAGYRDGELPATIRVALRLMVRQNFDGYTEPRAKQIARLLRGHELAGY